MYSDFMRFLFRLICIFWIFYGRGGETCGRTEGRRRVKSCGGDVGRGRRAEDREMVGGLSWNFDVVGNSFGSIFHGLPPNSLTIRPRVTDT